LSLCCYDFASTRLPTSACSRSVFFRFVFLFSFSFLFSCFVRNRMQRRPVLLREVTVTASRHQMGICSPLGRLLTKVNRARFRSRGLPAARLSLVTSPYTDRIPISFSEGGTSRTLLLPLALILVVTGGRPLCAPPHRNGSHVCACPFASISCIHRIFATHSRALFGVTALLSTLRQGLPLRTTCPMVMNRLVLFNWPLSVALVQLTLGLFRSPEPSPSTPVRRSRDTRSKVTFDAAIRN